MLDRFLRWVSRTRLWIWFSKYVLANVTLRLWGYPDFPMDRYYDMLRAIRKSAAEQPGLFVFTSTDTLSLAGMLIRWVSRSQYSHAGIFDPEGIFDATGEGCNILHMMSPGFSTWHVLALLREITDFSVHKYPLSPSQYQLVLQRIAFQKEKKYPYDFQQELETTDKASCSELVFRVLEGVPYLKDGVVRTVQPHMELERLLFLPDDVAEQAGELVWTHRSGR